MEQENTCNVISQTFDSLLNLFLGMYEVNQYVASIIVIMLVCLPFYAVYCLKNSNVAEAAAKVFGGASE
ncbi:hypothetical protein GNP84_04520 [Aliivibrio fischeri]|uniref:hypothetical protein n=1 Tax=Aliivibrio fischeri TaxID=668 RepID=UPI0012D855C5|nr:hypothetical protein [Aliivibrio fischeri]MUK76170.1 hypothetical protein [Aliivibrio fischeri]